MSSSRTIPQSRIATPKTINKLNINDAFKRVGNPLNTTGASNETVFFPPNLFEISRL
jgi:hypothetical protein